MNIQFLGAAQEVTGSMHLLTINDQKILLDCGLNQGKRSEAYDKNKNLSLDPASLSGVILSHAHIDHSGNLPQLVKKGYEGNIICTHATRDLANVMLRDSAHIQEKDVEYVNKRRSKKGLLPFKPLYTMEDAEKCIEYFVGLGYSRPFQVTPNVKVTFFDAGHILGSAIVVLDVKENGQSRRICFTGDLGRKNLPVIRDPVQVDEADVLITESTYGNRIHDHIEDMKSNLKEVVNKTIGRGGRIIVPSFAVGRTQELVYFLHELENEGALPEIPIYVDSPMAVNVTEVFRQHSDCFDKETRDAFLSNNKDPFGFYRLKYIRHVEESKKLNISTDPCIIISASGMCEAGRILHHLKNNISNPKNTILTIGFMAQNTLGRRIVEKQHTLKIFGETHPLKAEVVSLEGFSAHADKNELLTFFNGLNKEKLKQVFIVHGEPDQSNTLAEVMRSQGCDRVIVPELGQKEEI